MCAEGEIKPVGDVTRSDFSLYTGRLAKSALEKKAEEEAAAAAKQKK